jgi:YVTN family beta-propeller protein
VAAESANTVSVIDTATLRVVATILVGSRPRDSAFTPDGTRAYVSAEIGGVVSVVDVPSHKVVATVPIDRSVPKPKGVVVHPNGQWVYVANGGSNEVAVIDRARNVVSSFIAVGKRPWGVAISADGRHLYTANGVSGDVSVIDTESGKVIATIPVGTRPWGLVVGR